MWCGRAVGRSVYGHVITKFSGVGRFTKLWGSTRARGAPLKIHVLVILAITTFVYKTTRRVLQKYQLTPKITIDIAITEGPTTHRKYYFKGA